MQTHDLSGRDFSNQDLSHQDFSKKCFNGSYFIKAKLNGTQLQYAQMRGARFIYAELCGAQLFETNLYGANFTDADLAGADLRQADLRTAKLHGANLMGANLMGAKVQDARFSGSTGLTEDSKRDLKNRGAILEDSDSKATKLWWVQYVLVPVAAALIGSGGIMGLINHQKNERFSPPSSVPIQQPSTPSPKSIGNNGNSSVAMD